jgi:hypothetical protein
MTSTSFLGRLRDRVRVALKTLCRRFGRDSRGSVVTTFTLTLIPILGAVGAAVDYTRANNVKAALQASLDSAVLAGAKDATSNWAQVALNVFNGNVQSKGSTVATPTFTVNNGKYTGSVTAAVPTEFIGILHISSMNVSVTSVSAAASAPDGACILTLDHGKPFSHISMTFNGNPSINLSGCTLQSNTSLDCNGHSGGALASKGAGTVTGCTNPKSNAPVIPDIYGPLASNITKKCGASRPGVTWIPGSLPSPPSMITVNGSGYVEYHICGDLTLSGSGYLTGNPPAGDSIIVIENGTLTIANNASINATRTAIVLTGNNSYASSINFPNGNGHGATLSLSPPTGAGNPWRGVAIYQDPSLTNSVDDDWGPGATFNADGVIYLPNANVVLHGNSASNNSHCTKIVANTFTSNGNVNLNFQQTSSGCASIGMQQYAGLSVRLTQ